MKGRVSKTQADWVASSISTDKLETMLAAGMGVARQSFAGLLPTESQQALKAKLDQIDQEIKQAKN